MKIFKTSNKRCVLWILIVIISLLMLFWTLVKFGGDTVITEPEKPIIEPPRQVQMETLYTVKSGDTINDIANHFNTTWRELWEENKSTVKDPNLIYPGQKLRLGSKMTVRKIARSINSVEFNDRLYKLMFKQLGMTPAPEHAFNAILRSARGDSDRENYYRVRRSIDSIREALIGLETHELSKTITVLYGKDKDMAYLIIALAWRETGFHNRRGKKGELGYYQFLPSTIDKIYGKEKGKIAKMLVEENAWFATQLAVWYLNDLKRTYKTWDKALYHYNGDPDYSGWVMHKAKRVKEIMG